MRGLSSSGSVFVVIAATLAGATAALAQSGPAPAAGTLNFGASPRSGPGPRAQPGFGGEITGRMNLIGPAETAIEAPQFSVPIGAPAPIFAPQRLDMMTPGALDAIRLQGLVPAARTAPVAPKPAPGRPAATEAALTPPGAHAPVSPIKQRLQLAASFAPGGARIAAGVKWRLFTDQADANGEHMLVAESTDASPHFEVDPGAYIVHAVYGLVSAAKFVQVKAGQPADQSMVLSAGAVRITAFAGSTQATPDAVAFKLTRDADGVTRTVAEHVKSGELLRLPAGRYHVTSVYGDANATVEADLNVEAGKFVDAQIHHKAAQISLKLVSQPGGPELRDTSWTILTPGGDVIRDSIGALDKVVLAEGDYTAIARRDGRLFQQSFSVKAGAASNVEVVSQ